MPQRRKLKTPRNGNLETLQKRFKQSIKAHLHFEQTEAHNDQDNTISEKFAQGPACHKYGFHASWCLAVRKSIANDGDHTLSHSEQNILRDHPQHVERIGGIYCLR